MRFPLRAARRLFGTRDSTYGGHDERACSARDVVCYARCRCGSAALSLCRCRDDAVRNAIQMHCVPLNDFLFSFTLSRLPVDVKKLTCDCLYRVVTVCERDCDV